MGRLNGDDLGAMGEIKFADLCARAGLIFNKSTERDRAGWDYIVNLDFDESPNASLDKRRGPASCVVQVKTTSQSTAGVRMTLSMAERLAKDPHPCFICVLKADQNFEFTDAYLLHISGQRLASILKRLRQESKKTIDGHQSPSDTREPDWQSAARKARLNKLHIAFTPTSEERIAVSADALRAGLEDACGNDPALYSANKEKQRRELGYEGAPLQVVATFDAIKQSELEEAFLGLRENIKLVEMSATETRFDIELPQFSRLGGTISIQPASTDTCRMTFRAPGLRPASFVGQVFAVPPQIARGRKRLRVKGPYAEINVIPNDSEVSITMLAIWPEGAVPVDDWLAHFTVWQVMHLKGIIELEPDSQLMRFSLDGRDYQPPPSVTRDLELCEQFASVLKHAGIDALHKFQWVDIVQAHLQIHHLQHFIVGTVEPIVQKVPSAYVGVPEDLPDSVFMGMLTVGDLLIGYYVKGDISLKLVSDDMFEVRVDNWRLTDVRRLTGVDAAESYRRQIESIEKKDVGNLSIQKRTAIEE